MITTNSYIIFTLAILALLFIIFFILKKEKQKSRLSHLEAFSLIFVLLSVVFSENSIISYSLILIGIIIAIYDIYNKSFKKQIKTNKKK